MSRKAFYDHVAAKLFRGSLPDWQRVPLDRIIDEGVRRGRRLEEAAYALATAYHETARFKYMEEIGQGRGRDYGETMLLIRGKRVGYWGRGFVQLTWLLNYLKMERKLGIPLVDNPDKVTDPEIACQILWEGMIAGDFTGKQLSDYITDAGANYVNARRIINGTDKAELIAGYAREFEAGLRLIDGAAVVSTPANGCPLNVTTCPGRTVA